VYDSDYQLQKAAVSRKEGGSVPSLHVYDISTDRRDTLNEEILAFVSSVQTGMRPLVSGSDGRRALALARTITECITKGITGFVPVQ